MQRFIVFFLFWIFALVMQTGCFLKASIQSLDSESALIPSGNTSFTLKPSATQLILAEGDVDIVYNSELFLSLDHVYETSLEITILPVDIYAEHLTDYVVPLKVTLPAGEMSVNIPVLIKGDILGEGEESFKLQFFISNSAVQLNQTEVEILISDNDPIVLSVNPLYPVNGINFLNYIYRPIGNSLVGNLDNECNVAFYNMSVETCIDGGAFRKVIAIGQHSCDGLSMQDNLGIFNWKCDASSDPVFFYSTGFRSGKGLKNVLNSASFKNNFVTLKKNSTTIAASLDDVWWANPIVALSLNSGGADPRLTLSSAGTIYTIGSSGISRGLTINSKVALVNLAGVTVASANPVAGDCISIAGTQQCLINLITGSSFAYIEGVFQATLNLNNLIGIQSDSSFGEIYSLRINNSQLIGPGSGSVDGILSASTDISGFSVTSTELRSFRNGMNLNGQGWFRYFKDVTIANCSNFGMLTGSLGWHSKHIGLKLVNNGNHGYSGNPYYSQWVNIIAYNNAGSGLSIAGASNAILKNILTSGNFNGIQVGGDDATVNNISAFNNSNIGLEMVNYSNGSIFYNILSANNNYGFIQSVTSNIIYDLMLTNNNIGIQFSAGATGSSFHEKLILGNTTNCTYVGAGANPGLTGPDCENEGLSNAVRTLGISMSGHLKGKVTSEAINTHGTGLSLASSITDWLNFESPFRIWAHEAVGDFITATRGRCTGATNCRIWDTENLSLVAPFLNVRGDFVDKAVCPASVHGDNTELFNGVPNLKYASEVIGDWIGNDNGLCESGETCIFSPNIGYYQGAGDYEQKTCIFENGVSPIGVSAIKLHSF